MSEDQQKLQSLSDAYQKLQSDLQTHVATRQRLESQEQENLSVQKEFSALAPESNIYKMVGPCLLKQEREEAVQAVAGRLDFIKGEVKRVEGLIERCEKEGEGKKMEIFELQTRMQQGQQP